MSHTFKVLSIGGGLGGLALAQALRKHGVAYEIFERDESADSRTQGWALSLHWILEDLLGQTPDDMPSFDHVEESDKPAKKETGDMNWLTARILKQAGDHGFKHVDKD